MDIENTWWFKLRMRLHMLTHQHKTYVAEGIGEVQFCRPRGSWRTAMTITFPPDSGLNPVIIENIGPATSELLATSSTALELRRRAILVGGKGVTS